MSAPVVSAGTVHEKKPCAGQRRPRTTGGVHLGRDLGREARRLATAILEVLAGARTPTEAAQALSVSVPRYYQLESRALRGLVAACEARPPGRQSDGQRELARLRRDKERLQRALTRQQSLVRLTQRTVGLAPPPPPVAAKKGDKRRRRRAVARALHVAARLRTEALGEPSSVAGDTTEATS
jgi:hypothetical protein